LFGPPARVGGGRGYSVLAKAARKGAFRFFSFG
jgi:hypothetical protein